MFFWEKERQAIHITPLRLNTLAAFPPWGSSSGAGCMGLALVGKCKANYPIIKGLGIFSKPAFWLYLSAINLTTDYE